MAEAASGHIPGAAVKRMCSEGTAKADAIEERSGSACSHGAAAEVDAIRAEQQL